MAVCGAPWCDFMAVCSKTREIMLKRVFFQPRYWEHISSRLKQFCFALQVRERESFLWIVRVSLSEADKKKSYFRFLLYAHILQSCTMELT